MLEYKKILSDDVQGWAMISSGIYLRDRKTNVQYTITGLSDGKEMDKQYPTVDRKGTIYTFKMVFPKLPATIKSLDIIEPGEEGWKWENVNLVPAAARKK